MHRILLAEDDDAIVRLLTDFLREEGFAVTAAAGERSAREALERERFDLALVDLQLADGSGFGVCAAARARQLPVIFLTASSDESTVVSGFDMGADDYVAKPFRPRELVSRIRSVLRRCGRDKAVVTLGDVQTDIERGQVTKNGADVYLTALEYRLLLVSGAVSAAVYLVSARRRYRALADMSQDIDRVLHGLDSQTIAACDEGELAILSSEIRKMTVRLRQAADSQHRERMQLADAMADISHQLRTPLTAINLTLSMLGREGLPEQERRALLQELRRLVTRMEWLVETLLKMSRIDAGAVSFREESCRAADIIQRAVQPLAVPMELRGITLETAAGEECFTGDAAWSAEALGNVLKNCMEHAASYIRVSARETALFTEITVQDDGPGFRAEDLPRLFERFYRGKDAAPASVGIGLALTRMVLSAQNGTIRADNACPGGALFTLRWYRSTV